MGFYKAISINNFRINLCLYRCKRNWDNNHFNSSTLPVCIQLISKIIKTSLDPSKKNFLNLVALIAALHPLLTPCLMHFNLFSNNNKTVIWAMLMKMCKLVNLKLSVQSTEMKCFSMEPAKARILIKDNLKI